jgi:SAM-dependent methyltransferase
MAPDVVDLRGFYATPLGETARQLIARRVQGWWTNCAGLSLMGLGYATPYLEPLRAGALRTLAFMPAEQGVVNWPTSGLSASALVETTSLPLPDACIDRAIVVHALETAEHPGALLEEIWRVLTPGGRMILICPSRSGVWARVDTTPFGHGQPWSRSQLRDLMRQSLFSPETWAEALYMPPVAGRTFLRSAFAFESIGAKLSLPGAGVHVVEATKQLYRPVGARRPARRALPSLQPALSPAGVSPTTRTTTIKEING